MNQQNQTSTTCEMLSLNLDDLDVEELEHRLELAAAVPTCLRSGGDICGNKVTCTCHGRNG